MYPPPRLPTTQLVTVAGKRGSKKKRQYLAINDPNRLRKRQVKAMIPVKTVENDDKISEMNRRRRRGSGASRRGSGSSRSSGSKRRRSSLASDFDPWNGNRVFPWPVPYAMPQSQPQPQQQQSIIPFAGIGSVTSELGSAMMPISMTSNPTAQLGFEAIQQLGLNARRNMELEPLRNIVLAFAAQHGAGGTLPAVGMMGMVGNNSMQRAAAMQSQFQQTYQQSERSRRKRRRSRRSSGSSFRGSLMGQCKRDQEEYMAHLDPNLCPYCGVGVFVKKTTVTGYLTACLCFPCGLICCLSGKCCFIMECTYCHAVSDKKKVACLVDECDHECKDEAEGMCTANDYQRDMDRLNNNF